MRLSPLSLIDSASASASSFIFSAFPRAFSMVACASPLAASMALCARHLARNIPKGYEALDLYTGNIQQVQERFEQDLRPLLANKGVILEAFGLRKIDFREDYVQAIEQKQIEAENVTTEKNRAEQATWRAQSAIEEAKGEAAATVENAKGEAEKITLLAEAEAKAIEVKGEMLKKYPEIIQLEFVSSLSDPDSNVTWGIMPQGGVMPFLNVPPE